MSDGVLASLQGYWSAKRAGLALPTRDDIDPSEIRRLLSHLAMVDVLDGGERFRFRLVGTGVVRHLKFDPTGRDLGTLPSTGPGSAFWSFLQSVVGRREPVVDELAYFGASHVFGSIRLVGLPLAGRDGNVAIVLLACRFIASMDLKAVANT